MYKLWIELPGQGRLPERGRAVAKTAIANLDVDRF